MTGDDRLVSYCHCGSYVSSLSVNPQIGHLHPSQIDKLAFCIDPSHFLTTLHQKPPYMPRINIRYHSKRRRKQLLRIRNPPLARLHLLQNRNILPPQELLVLSLNKTLIHPMKTSAKSSRCIPLLLSSILNLLQKLGPYKRFMGSVYGHANEELDLFAREWD